MNKFFSSFNGWFVKYTLPRLKKLISLAFVFALVLSSLYYYKLVEVAESLKTVDKKGDAKEASIEPNSTTQRDQGEITVPQPANNLQDQASQSLYDPSVGALNDISSSKSLSGNKKVPNTVFDQYRQGKMLQTRLLSIILLFLLFVVLFVLVFLWMYHLHHVRTQRFDLQADPDDFKKLFNEFTTQIATLDTPRRIKRFVNKLRFQYTLLKEQGLLSRDIDRRFVFHVSIEGEKNPGLYSTEQSFNEELEKFIKQNDEDVTVTEKLYKELFNINQVPLLEDASQTKEAEKKAKEIPVIGLHSSVQRRYLIETPPPSPQPLLVRRLPL